MTNPQATTTVSKLDFALVEVSQSKTPIYSEQNGALTLTKRRSIRNKMKSLKINYLQGGNSCGLCFLQIAQKRAKPESFAP